MSYTHKMVNGVAVELTPEEIAELEARDAAQAALLPDRDILAQIAALEALLTPRLTLEAACAEECTVSKPGCCIDGLTPTAALAQINTELKALRAQLTVTVYYQAEEGG